MEGQVEEMTRTGCVRVRKRTALAAEKKGLLGSAFEDVVNTSPLFFSPSLISLGFLEASVLSPPLLSFVSVCVASSPSASLLFLFVLFGTRLLRLFIYIFF